MPAIRFKYDSNKSPVIAKVLIAMLIADARNRLEVVMRVAKYHNKTPVAI